MQEENSHWVKIFQSRLKEAMKGRKQSEIANEIGVGQPNLSMYVSTKNGRHIPNLERFRALCLSLGVKSDWLLGLTEEPGRGVSVHAGGNAAVASQSPGAKVAAHAVAADTSRLLSIIESQQRVIENLSKR